MLNWQSQLIYFVSHREQYITIIRYHSINDHSIIILNAYFLQSSQEYRETNSRFLVLASLRGNKFLHLDPLHFKYLNYPSFLADRRGTDVTKNVATQLTNRTRIYQARRAQSINIISHFVTESRFTQSSAGISDVFFLFRLRYSEKS